MMRLEQQVHHFFDWVGFDNFVQVFTGTGEGS